MIEPTVRLPFETPHPVLPFQAAGVEFLTESLQQGISPLLADDPGLGKTIQTVLAARLLNIKPVLILCPPVAREVWRRELTRWWPEVASEVGCPWGPRDLGRYMFDIIGYQHISEWTDLRGALLDHQYELMVLDEVHRLGKTSKRARVVWGKHYNGKGACLLNNASRGVIALSGTPMPNHAGELFNITRGLWPDRLEAHDPKLVSREVYEDRFCRIQTVQNRKIIRGSKNLHLVKDMLRGRVLRRRKAEVRPEFPAMRFDVEPMSGTLTDSDARDVKQAALEALGTTLGDSNAIDVLGNNLNAHRDRISAVRRLTGMLKAPFVVDHVAQWMADNPHEKVILFAHHRDVCSRLHKDLANFNPVLVSGQTTEGQDTYSIQRFQTNPNCRLFVGQIEACGEAITLTASSRVFFAESDWTPSKNYQAACRADRIGQTAAVLATFLHLPGSVDELLQSVQMRKTREIAEVFG